ncbi:MAG: acetolactate synthase large subunit [Alteromonadaceae bacterium]|uniref:acetolactate synthase large subunit n=1 Tax=Marinobacter sp. BGYM27 TaxID=2975597 RepID=UPI000C55B0A7|nr:acetolactate synthase large subunit [Marinobacter sp. BGYM27]MAA66671.1 acetolactate synthase large subunit [Alteromonadaceae bacterium]MBH84835.1 acetolactate synthase large subunit [Alteromonadaceae bacterium]MDG5501429.1 acetolactate synthase large subunit [Marinobacter sp. BGYM27]|tara:strand:+ start:4150 stop:5829 length:1680 start_codon:yes stop_codon:yes gene_type:complete
MTDNAPTTRPTKGSDLFVKALENEGVEYIFGIPGEENLDLLESIRNSGIRLIVNRHEQAAGFMAATYGRLTGRVGVCLSTLGPGATNLVTAAAYAQLGAMPMLMITGQKPIKSSKQGLFQILDIVDLMRPLTKYTRQISNANTIPAKLREAFRLAAEERPGAVHVELPEDIASEMSSADAHIFQPSDARRPTASAKSLQQACDMIKAARHPLIMIGAGANRKRVSRALINLVEATGIPFFTTQMGKGVIDERHPRYLGNAALSSGDFVHCAIDHADLVVNVGHDVVEKPPFFMHPGGKQVIHINFSPADVDPVYFPQLEVVGDIANSVDWLAANCGESEHHDFEQFMTVKQSVENHLRECIDDSRFPLVPQRIVADVRKVMPEDGIIALDNGMYKIWFARNYKAYDNNTVLLDNALASMGAGLPSAMAAAMLYPEQKIMAICGDGGFMMNSQELETAVRLELNLVVMIINDNGFGMIQWKQDQEDFSRFGLDYGNPDFVAYANAYGATGHRINSADELVPKLTHAMDAGGVHVIEVPVDYSENDRVFNRQLKDLTCTVK